MELLLLALGIASGAFLFWLYTRLRLSSFKKLSQAILQKADQEAEMRKASAQLALKQKEFAQQQLFEQQAHEQRKLLQQEQARLKEREDKVDTRLQALEKRAAQIEKREQVLHTRKEILDKQKKEQREEEQRLLERLQQLSGLSQNEAREKLLQQLSAEIHLDSAKLIHRLQSEALETAEQEATRILTTTINRLAVPCVSEATITTVTLPNEELKGRIIGREGRNIRALEQATGVTFIIDETPGAIVISGFDPIRKQIAKTALKELLQDGRIHPTRIEESVAKSKELLQKQIKQFGEEAALKAGVADLHPELILLLGKLKFRFSFAQNVLDHSLEVAHLLGMMAEELGLNGRLARRIGLLHDVGKAVSHEIEGTHALIGRDLALKYGESPEVANGIGCHHAEIPPTTFEGSLCSAADAISATRPGGRLEETEQYIKRLKRLEELSSEFPHVEKAYALQAGREIRVLLSPEGTSDENVTHLARAIAKKVEKEFSYPGKIKITVIREKRVTEYAL